MAPNRLHERVELLGYHVVLVEEALLRRPRPARPDGIFHIKLMEARSELARGITFDSDGSRKLLRQHSRPAPAVVHQLRCPPPEVASHLGQQLSNSLLRIPPRSEVQACCRSSHLLLKGFELPQRAQVRTASDHHSSCPPQAANQTRHRHFFQLFVGKRSCDLRLQVLLILYVDAQLDNEIARGCGVLLLGVEPDAQELLPLLRLPREIFVNSR